MAGPKVYGLVTVKILKALEAGTAPWSGGGSFPRSLATGDPYRGINPFLLQMEGIAGGLQLAVVGHLRPDRRAGQPDPLRRAVGRTWGDDRLRSVTKGQRGTPIVFWARTTKEVTDPVTGLCDGGVDVAGVGAGGVGDQAGEAGGEGAVSHASGGSEVDPLGHSWVNHPPSWSS